MNIFKVKRNPVPTNIVHEAVKLTADNLQAVQIWVNGVSCHEPNLQNYRMVVIGLDGLVAQAKIGQWLVKRGSLVEVLDDATFAYMYVSAESAEEAATKEAMAAAIKAWDAVPERDCVASEWNGWLLRMNKAIERMRTLTT